MSFSISKAAKPLSLRGAKRRGTPAYPAGRAAGEFLAPAAIRISFKETDSHACAAALAQNDKNVGLLTHRRLIKRKKLKFQQGGKKT
jgi:hypothetical protein